MDDGYGAWMDARMQGRPPGPLPLLLAARGASSPRGASNPSKLARGIGSGHRERERRVTTQADFAGRGLEAP